MKRRGITVLAGAVLVAALTFLIGQAKVPYVEMVPGPTYDTLGEGVIVINGTETSESAGQLRFVTVGVISELTLVQALVGWFDDDAAVVPAEIFAPPEETPQESEERNREAFVQSEAAATSAALLELGYSKVVVSEVVAGSPADGLLRAQDVIRSVDGTAVTRTGQLTELIGSQPPGPHTFEVERDGETVTVEVTSVDDAGTPRVGISASTQVDKTFDVKIPNEDEVGGPSAGLMLTLGIIDKLEPEDLTGGRIIAGTGTIAPDGTVGPIGGVPQKLLGARAAGAEFFLTPVDNCAEATANAVSGVSLVQVATLDDALAALTQIRAGETPLLCSR